MKKVLAVLALSAIFAACNSSTESTETPAETKVEEAAKPVDSTVNAVVDSTQAAAPDSLKK